MKVKPTARLRGKNLPQGPVRVCALIAGRGRLANREPAWRREVASRQRAGGFR